MIPLAQTQGQQALCHGVGPFPILLVGPANVERVAKFRITGINNSFLRRKLISALIEEIAYRGIEEIDPLAFGLPVGQAIGRHAHRCPPAMRSSFRSKSFCSS